MVQKFVFELPTRIMVLNDRFDMARIRVDLIVLENK